MERRGSGRRSRIPSHVRAAVLARDGMVCRRCTVPVVVSVAHRPDRLHLDHVKPWAEGGEDTTENLVVCCARCNLGRPRPKPTYRRREPVGLTRTEAAAWLATEDGQAFAALFASARRGTDPALMTGGHR
jgi:5-methylcytosine-specific restriction endonuclease McrA